MLGSAPILDFTQIAFPSDRLTVKDLRRDAPGCFDLTAPEHLPEREGFLQRQSIEYTLGGIINTERELAAIAFFAALGTSPLESFGKLGPRDFAAECLANDYVRLGLASGQHHAEQLIRDFEQAAADQARKHLPNLPSR
jgi:hypothetical protein